MNSHRIPLGNAALPDPIECLRKFLSRDTNEHLVDKGYILAFPLLIQGARSSLQRAQAVTRERATPEQIWIKLLSARMPFGKLLVAIANKLARQLWVMLARNEDYGPHAWLKHPMVQRAACA